MDIRDDIQVIKSTTDLFNTVLEKYEEDKDFFRNNERRESVKLLSTILKKINEDYSASIDIIRNNLYEDYSLRSIDSNLVETRSESTISSDDTGGSNNFLYQIDNDSDEDIYEEENKSIKIDSDGIDSLDKRLKRIRYNENSNEDVKMIDYDDLIDNNLVQINQKNSIRSESEKSCPCNDEDDSHEISELYGTENCSECGNNSDIINQKLKKHLANSDTSNKNLNDTYSKNKRKINNEEKFIQNRNDSTDQGESIDFKKNILEEIVDLNKILLYKKKDKNTSLSNYLENSFTY